MAGHGLTPFDVSNLESQINNLGESALQRQRLRIAEDTRQKILDVEMRRLAAEQNRDSLLQQGHVSAAYEDPDAPGVQMTYQGPQAGLDAIMAQAQAKGKSLQPAAPKKLPFSITVHKSDGDIGFGADTAEKAKAIIQQFQDLPDKQQGKPYKPAVIQETEMADQMDDQADQLEQQGDVNSPEGMDMLVKASRLRASAKQLRQPKGPQADPNAVKQTVTNETNPITGQVAPKTTFSGPVGAPGWTNVPGMGPGQGGQAANPAFSLMKNKAGQTVKVPQAKVQWATQNGYSPAQ